MILKNNIFLKGISVFKLIFKNPLTIWMKFVFFLSYFQFKNFNHKLSIGYKAQINNTVFGKYNTIYSNVSLVNVNIEDFSYVADRSKLSNVHIGKFCCIGPDVLIGLGRHPSKNFVSVHPVFYSLRAQSQITFANKSYYEEFENIRIGNDVWIGARAIILDGITIGDGAIVAAGSVVSKDVPPYAVVAGVPARVLRYRFKENEVSFLQNLKWWDKDLIWLQDNYQKFHDIKKMMVHSDE